MSRTGARRGVSGSLAITANSRSTSSVPAISKSGSIVVSGGVITEVKALLLPTGGGYTKRVTTFFQTQIPSRIVADQGWKISSVGGATYTSRAYSQSLQSAINQAS
jgi:uncharacterized protein with FMN-binding domain